MTSEAVAGVPAALAFEPRVSDQCLRHVSLAHCAACCALLDPYHADALQSGVSTESVRSVNASLCTMPELPEVEAARKLAAANCQGKKITLVTANEDLSAYSSADTHALARVRDTERISVVSMANRLSRLYAWCQYGNCAHRALPMYRWPANLQSESRCAEVFQGHTPSEVQEALTGRVIEDVLRKGKYFWFKMSGDGPDILWHFGMTGYLSVKGVGSAKYVKIKTDADWPPRFTKVELTFEDGTIIAFADARRYAALLTQRL